jgi:hypothetical protein
VENGDERDGAGGRALLDVRKSRDRAAATSRRVRKATAVRSWIG